jgi:hypothetical protein
MANMKFRYPSEKLLDARRSLMLPHPEGEAQSIADAFSICRRGFDHLNPDDLDDDARRWFTKLGELMDTSGVQDPEGRGTFVVKASGFSLEQRRELSDAVDQLTEWLESAFWERH